MKKFSFTHRGDVIATLVFILLPLLVYPLAATRRGVFYVGDIFRFFYPQRAVYASALRHGHVPLWTPEILGGFPLLAEMQTGVFYPLNLLLYRILPIDLALNYSLLLALSLSGVAMYMLGRILQLRPAAAFLAALTFTYSGFFVGHLNHLNMMAAVPWLPVELAIIEKAVGTARKTVARSSIEEGPRKWRPTIGLAIFLSLTIGIHFVAGHPQNWLMSILVVLAFGLFRSLWPATGARRSMAQAIRQFAPVVLAVTVGITVAAVQLLPTWELVQHSIRAGGLSPGLVTSFSLQPTLLITLVVPFFLGNPYPNVSVELSAYVGLLPLALAVVAPVLRRDRRLSAFLVGLAGLTLMLAFGHNTPLYALLAQVPVLNFFRAPARFLYLFTLAIALLAGCGLDALLARYDRSNHSRSHAGLSASSRTPSGSTTAQMQWRAVLRGVVPPQLVSVPTAFVASSALISVLAIRAASLDTLLSLRWILPSIILLVTLGLLMLAWRQRIERRTLVWAAIGLTLVDLSVFTAVYRLTYNDLITIDEFYEKPASLNFFPEETHTYRTFTHEAIVPAMSVMRASLYPNTSLLYGIHSANGWFPSLLPADYARYLADLTPSRLNLLNARYFLIPQLLPVDPETEYYDLHNPFTPDPIGRSIVIPPTRAEKLELVSFTSQSADWTQGELVAEIVLTSHDETTIKLPIRVGRETAEWAYDRSDVMEQVAHEQPPVARTWPARSGFPPENHPGHTYQAQYEIPSTIEVTEVRVVPVKPDGLLHIEEISLLGQNRQYILADLVGLGHHRLAYRDPDVTIYENLDALPRAFVVDRARVVSDDETALSIIDDPNFEPCSEVLLSSALTVEESARQTLAFPLQSSDPSTPSEHGWLQDNNAWWNGRGLNSPAPDHISYNIESFGSEVSKSTSCISESTAQIIKYTPRRVEIQVDLHRPGYLVLLDSYYPGWQATVDSQPTTIQRANVLFRAVPLEAGQHLVTFVYDPFTFKLGSAISLVTLAGLALATLWLILQ